MDTPTNDQRRVPWLVVFLGTVIGFGTAVVLSGVVALTLWFVGGGPVSDEWICSRGEYTTGNDCRPYGEPVPAGQTAYPNGPLDEETR